MQEREEEELREMGCAVVRYTSAASINDIPLASQQKEQAPIVHPWDDPYVLAGLGTVGLEIVQQTKDAPELDAIFVSANAGGLLEGAGIFFKRFRPHVQIIGVRAQSPAVSESQSQHHRHGFELEQGNNKWLAEPGSFFSSNSGEQTETGRVHDDVVDRMMFVEAGELWSAIEDVFGECRVIMDQDGALAVAGMKRYAAEERLSARAVGNSLLAVISSANVAFDQLHAFTRTGD